MKVLIVILQVYLCSGIWTNHPCTYDNKPPPTPDPIYSETEINSSQIEAILLEVQNEARKLMPFRISTALQIAEVKDICLSGKSTISNCRKSALKVIKELQNTLLKAERAVREEERIRLQRSKLSRSTKR